MIFLNGTGSHATLTSGQKDQPAFVKHSCVCQSVFWYIHEDAENVSSTHAHSYGNSLGGGGTMKQQELDISSDEHETQTL